MKIIQNGTYETLVGELRDSGKNEERLAAARLMMMWELGLSGEVLTIFKVDRENPDEPPIDYWTGENKNRHGSFLLPSEQEFAAIRYVAKVAQDGMMNPEGMTDDQWRNRFRDIVRAHGVGDWETERICNGPRKKFEAGYYERIIAALKESGNTDDRRAASQLMLMRELGLWRKESMSFDPNRSLLADGRISICDGTSGNRERHIDNPTDRAMAAVEYVKSLSGPPDGMTNSQWEERFAHIMRRYDIDSRELNAFCAELRVAFVMEDKNRAE